ncbi:MAG TPA: hypothetical protein VED18_11730 [Candidatus Sulfotelmatobacter sp.]|nr:hypothetical protein [Candidatus Sulfotelmatobacter sp.]
MKHDGPELRNGDFYDGYWPANVPDFRRTREHILGLFPERSFGRALDAGCGTGVCSLALAGRARVLCAAGGR